MFKWLSSLVAESDGSPSPVHITGLVTGATIVGLTIYMAIAHGQFDPMVFAGSMSANAIATAGSAAIKNKFTGSG